MQVPLKFRGALVEVLSNEAKDIGEDPRQGPVTEERILRSGGCDTVEAVRQGGCGKDHQDGKFQFPCQWHHRD